MLAARNVLFSITALIIINAGQIPSYGSESGPPAGLDRPQDASVTSPVIHRPGIISTYPHDPGAFTQGLVFEGGYLYEGTGLYGRSSLRKTVLETGNVVQKLDLPDRFFGEGITIVRDGVVQLTWRSRVGFVYARDSLQLVRAFRYSTEGWGITYDGRRLIMSDGTEYLYFLDPETYRMSGKIRVHDDHGFIKRLNELEFIKGRIYANVWQSGRIAVIDPETGRVSAWIELQELVKTAGGDNTTKTLNGIAYDKENDRLFVTGKMWPSIYEIERVPSED